MTQLAYAAGVPCSVCRSDRVVIFAEVPNVPVLCNILWPSEAEAKAVPRISIRLGFCHQCGHIFNPDFDLTLMDYSQTYENSLHFSPRFQRYAEELAQELVEQHGLYGKRIVEIGSGKGDFLEMLCELGDNHGVGFDPSYLPGATERTKTHQIEYIQDFYSEKYADRSADFVCCRHTLEHIDDPIGFMQMVRRTIGERDAMVFFEVPNGLFTLQDMAIWDIIYEHCSYFTRYSLTYLFESCGFAVMDVRTTFDDQYLCISAKPKNDNEIDSAASWNRPAEILSDVNEFATRYRAKAQEDNTMLSAMAAEDKKVVIWGSGSKGITYLNLLPAAEAIAYAVDINPRKQGKYITGGGQRIVAPEFLNDYAPDAVIVMNPIYGKEILATLTEMGLTSTLYHA